MAIGHVCTREVVVAYPETPVAEAARLMREHHVGDLVVVAGTQSQRVPLGVVTDRDLVVEVLAREVPVAGLTLGEIMLQDLVTAREDEGVFDAIELMRARGVRRMPIVDAQGVLVGIVSLDDLLEILAEELNALVGLISREQAAERQARK
ncbi:MAG: CBS domain-containing protein [Betaproteobacteria bacterium]|nr:CBS domain-containing protein [Betaproteobacteria bacterium]